MLSQLSCGVRGLCNMQGLEALTDGLATLVDGLGSTMPPGLVKLLRADDRPPGLDMDWFKLPESSSGGVFASPMLPQLPKLSSDWVPSLLSPASMYLMHFFLRLKQTVRQHFKCKIEYMQHLRYATYMSNCSKKYIILTLKLDRNVKNLKICQMVIHCHAKITIMSNQRMLLQHI